jgi:hypothetical protein
VYAIWDRAIPYGDATDLEDVLRDMPSSNPPCGAFARSLLTAAAAVLAMIPLMPSVFWGLMAMAIMGGLLV